MKKHATRTVDSSANVGAAAFRDFVIRSGRLRKLIAWTIATPIAIAASSKILDQVFRPDAAPADFDTAAGALLGASIYVGFLAYILIEQW